jgi:hypothetical protein
MIEVLSVVFACLIIIVIATLITFKSRKVRKYYYGSNLYEN